MTSTFSHQSGGVAVIYLRVSTDEQVDNYSLETQETGCIQEAQRRGFKILQIFREEGKSAKTIKGRPMLLELLALCGMRQREIDAIIIYRVDRLARQTIDYLSIRAKLARMDITVISVNEPTGDSPMDKLTETLLAGIAQFENEVRSERSKQGLRARFLTGLSNGLVPIGYLHGGNSPAQPDPLAFEMIKYSWNEVGTGKVTLRELSDSINDRGLYATFPQPHRVHMTSQTLSRIFHNKFYTGMIVSKKYGQEMPGRHPAMISEELFYRVQRVLHGRNRNPRVLLKRDQNNPDFSLRCVVKCGGCGRWFSGGWTKGKHKRYAYYFAISVAAPVVQFR